MMWLETPVIEPWNKLPDISVTPDQAQEHNLGTEQEARFTKDVGDSEGVSSASC